jgi:phosphate transport system substrate-binding protein
VKVSFVTRTAGIAAIAAIGLAACGSNGSGSHSSGGTGGGAGSSTTSLAPQGSTFQQTLEQQWASDYHSAHANAQITYTGTGSSTGIAQFTAGKIAFAGSDVTMTSQEQTQANNACGSTALTVPITAGGVAIVFNLPGVTSLKLDASTLAGIFMGKITKWSDPQLVAQNPGLAKETTSISMFHRADGSGTTDVLSGFLTAFAPKVWTLGVNKEFTWPSGQGAQGSSGVVQGVKNTPGGITYAEVTYAQQDSLPTAQVEGNTSSGYQAISAASVTKSINSGFTVTGASPDLAGALSFTKMTGYPISTVSYVLVCSKYSNSAEGALVKDYLTYAAGAGQAKSASLGFAPLPASLDRKVLASIATIS